VTLVSTTVFDFGSAAAASDGDVDPNGNNGQIYTNDPGGYPSDYFANADPIVLDMNLGQTYFIDSIAFWNRGVFNNNSVSSFSAVFSTDSTFGNGDDSSTFTYTPAIGVDGTQQDFALGTTLSNAQFVRITINDNYYDPGNAGAGGDRVNFTEFQFNVVPEPSSFMLLALTGIASLLLLRTRT
jgi:hypothetical protein